MTYETLTTDIRENIAYITLSRPERFNLGSRTASQSAGTMDFEEEVTAFVEKRKPLFRGK